MFICCVDKGKSPVLRTEGNVFPSAVRSEGGKRKYPKAPGRKLLMLSVVGEGDGILRFTVSCGSSTSDLHSMLCWVCETHS